MVKILSRYSDRERVPTVCSGLSRTKQAFKDESDINNIVRRYNKTGVMTDGVSSGRVPMFGDFTGYDYRAYQTYIATVRQSFDLLPAELRRRFDNDPALLIDWLSDESNKDEAIKLGLRVQDAPVNEPATAPELPKDPVPAVSPEPVKSPDLGAQRLSTQLLT